MPWWTLLWTWAVVIAQTATQNLLPFPSTGLSPAPKLMRVGAEEGDGPDLILVFFPGFRLVPWFGGKINVEHKARALVDAVSGPGHRLFLYWPEHDTADARDAAETAAGVISTIAGPANVIIVGESYGGVAAMHLAERIEDTPNIRRVEVLTAASPLHGTGLAQPWIVDAFAPFYGRGIRDLMPMANGYLFEGAETFATTTDLLVWPQSTTAVDGKMPKHVLWGVPHGAVVLHPKFIACLAKKACEMEF